MKKQPDRRIAKSRKAMHAGLLKLLATKQYQEITIQEILDLADVGRSTFYAHFHDKDQLLIWGILNLEHELAAQVEAASRRKTTQGIRGEGLFEISLAFYAHAELHKAVYRSLKSSGAWHVVRAAFEQMLARLMLRDAEHLRRPSKQVPHELFVQYLSSTAIEVMTWWMEKSRHLSAQEVAKAYRALVQPNIL